MDITVAAADAASVSRLTSADMRGSTVVPAGNAIPPEPAIVFPIELARRKGRLREFVWLELMLASDSHLYAGAP